MLAPFCATGPHQRNIEALLTLRQACDLAGVAPITLRRWTNEGKLQCLRTIGGSRRFRSSDILAAFGQTTETTVGEENSKRDHVIPVAVIIRVSSKGQASGQGSSYQLQEERLRNFVKDHFKGQRVELTFYKRVASGLNLENEIFLALVNDVLAGKFNGGFVVAENPNRVARFAVSLFKHLCSLGNATLIYSLSDEESKSDHETLVEDVLSILQHFTARVTGQKAKKILSVKVDPGTVKRVLSLRHSGHSYLAIAEKLERDGVISECGKPITRNVVWRIVKENGKLLGKLELDTDLSCCSPRQSWERFIAQRLRKADASCTLPLKTVLAEYRTFCGHHGWSVLTESIALNAILCQKLPVQKAFNHNHTRIYRRLRLVEGESLSKNEQLPGGALPRGSSLAEPPTSATSTNPPLGDCSPSTKPSPTESPTRETAPAPTPFHDAPSRQISFPYDDALAGLCLMEKNLLTLLENTLHDEPDRLESLHYSLSNVRRQKASLQLRLSPSLPGALLSTDTPDHSPSSFNPQPQAQAPAQLET